MINGVQPAPAGCDMDMPGFKAYGQGDQNEADPATAVNSWWGVNLIEAARNGSVPEWRVDDMVTRTLAAWYKLGQDSGYPDVNFNHTTQETYSSIDGHEVPQLYISFPDGAGEPPRVLRGFERVFIAAGASVTVDLTLRTKDISVWDVVQQKWVVPKGTFTVSIGSSSRRLHLSAEFSA
jgi:hypothetical protein